jgi:DNA-directed RNA polymerase specialized sigma24 family protein
MNLTDLQIFEMYFVDGMKEAEIADSLGLSLLTVHEVLAELENMTRSEDAWPDEVDINRR